MARPTKYTPELLERAYEYIEEWEQELLKPQSKDEGLKAVNSDVVPSHGALFLTLEISRSNGYDWATDPEKQEFSDILGKVKALQRRILINMGLSGGFNAAIAKLMLGKHGIHEKSEQDITSGGKEIVNNFTIMPVTTKKGNDDV